MHRRDVVKAMAAVLALAGVPAVVIRSVTSGKGYTETYKGRSISIAKVNGAETVLIDGRELHVMKMGDNAYLSAMCHYSLAPTPLVAARRAVDELRGANLLPIAHRRHHAT